MDEEEKNLEGCGDRGTQGFDLDLVVDEANRVLGRLNEVWEEMGLHEEERVAQLGSLHDSIMNVFNTKLEEEMALKEEYEKLAERLEEEIYRLRDEVLQLDPEEFDIDKPDDIELNLMRNISWLRNKQQDLNEIKSERLKKIQPIFDQIKTTSKQLNIDEPDEFKILGDIITNSRLSSLNQRLTFLHSEKTNRYNSLIKTSQTYTTLLSELAITDPSSLDKAILSFSSTKNKDIDLSLDFINKISDRVSHLSSEKDSRIEQLKQVGAEIQVLWDLLDVSDEFRAKFFAEHTGLGLAVVSGCIDELERLRALKREQLMELVKNKRIEIQDLWEKLSYSSRQKLEFTSLHETECNDELFETHQSYLVMLQEKYALLEPILSMIEKYKELCEERRTYELLIQDSSRLLDRKRGIGQLKQEEMQRKRVEKGLPKLVSRLKESISEYEKENGDLILDGESCLQSILQSEKVFAENKEEQKRVKKLQRKNSSSPMTSAKKFNASGKSKLGSNNENLNRVNRLHLA